MIEVAVIDTSAEARRRLAERIGEFQKEASVAHAVCPQINIKPLSVHELKFSTPPDIIIIGCHCLRQDLTEIATIKKVFTAARIIAELDSDTDNLVATEQMARLGVDDTITRGTSATEFFRKLILLHRNKKPQHAGTCIIVDSGKGGMGVTSLVAGLAEVCLESGKKVAVIDLDVETQDLSRFLQARPFVNENLDALLNQERPIVSDTIQQCAYQVWEGNDKFLFVPPPQQNLHSLDRRDSRIRTFLSFLEALDKIVDILIVDIAGIRGALREALIRVGDKILFTVQNDPASLFASIHALRGVCALTATIKDVILVENAHSRQGLPSDFLRDEIARQLRIEVGGISIITVPHCVRGGRWPASGGTLMSEGARPVQGALREIAETLNLIPRRLVESPKYLKVGDKLQKLRALLRRKRSSIEAPPLVQQLRQAEPLLTLPTPIHEDDLVEKAKVI